MLKKLIILICSIVIPISVHAQADESYNGYVYFTVERTTLGQGLIGDIQKVGFYNGESLAQISQRALGELSGWNEPNISNYYISTIYDGGEPKNWSLDDIPTDIYKYISEDIYDRENGTELSEFDYTVFGGWMFSVDNVGLVVGAGAVVFSDKKLYDGKTYSNGSVIRLMFSTYGWGEDIGFNWGYYPFDTTNTFSDRSELISLAAECKDKSSEKYKIAYVLLSKWDTTKSEIEITSNLLKYNISKSNNSATFSALHNIRPLICVLASYADGRLSAVKTDTLTNGELTLTIQSGNQSKAFMLSADTLTPMAK